MERLIQLKNKLFKILFKVLSLLFLFSDIIALPFWRLVAFLIAKDTEEYKKHTDFKIFTRINTSSESYTAYIGFKMISAIFLFAICLAVILSLHSN